MLRYVLGFFTLKMRIQTLSGGDLQQDPISDARNRSFGNSFKMRIPPTPRLVSAPSLDPVESAFDGVTFSSAVGQHWRETSRAEVTAVCQVEFKLSQR